MSDGETVTKIIENALEIAKKEYTLRNENEKVQVVFEKVHQLNIQIEKMENLSDEKQSQVNDLQNQREESRDKLLNEKLAVIQKLMDMKNDLESKVPTDEAQKKVRDETVKILRQLDVTFKKVKL